MKTSIKLTIFITILILGFAIASLVLYWPLLTGKTMILATRPVDPFDPFMGQYMTISYEISQVSRAAGASQEKVPQTVYISLEEDNTGIFRYKDSSLEKPAHGDFIKGSTKSVSGNNMNVEYGIEQFYFERGATLPTQNITVEVKVSSTGQARISKLLHNGEPIKIKYRTGRY